MRRCTIYRPYPSLREETPVEPLPRDLPDSCAANVPPVPGAPSTVRALCAPCGPRAAALHATRTACGVRCLGPLLALGAFGALVALLPTPAAAQAPAGTDIWLADLAIRGGRLEVGAPVNITDRDGYDNQPAFTPDGRAVLYTSIREDGQADIYRYDIATRAHERVTRTPESEYSPTPLPDGSGFSVIRVEADSTQRLWRFAADGSGAALVLEAVRPVGYHAWGDDAAVALFVLGDPPTLRIADARSGRVDVVASDIGRSLHRIPGRREISFLHRVAGGERWIEAVDLATREVRPLAPPLDGSEDYAWTPDGTLLMGQGSRLFRWDADAREWRLVADLATAGVRGITRIAVSPRGDRLAIVGDRGG
jgi:dipeptidyl aminopeptidase/acylaminoacyl peptidase